MRYYNEFDLPPVIPSETGDGKMKRYRLDPIKNDVVLDGEDDLQELINAAKDSCDMHKIIARFKQTNDETLLKIRSTIEGGDFTMFPDSALAAQMQLRELRDKFLADPDLVAKFGTFPNFITNGLNPAFYEQAKPAENTESPNEGDVK